MIDIKVDVSKPRSAINRRIREIENPNGALGKAVQMTTRTLRKAAGPLTHVDTGALRSSHRIRFGKIGKEFVGVVYPHESVMNPRTNRSVQTYAVHEHSRGGEHAFYTRTVDNHGRDAVAQAVRAISRELGNA